MKLKAYVVRQGDYLTKLAHRLGFSAERVWSHPKNAELKELRKEMDILWPGDLLHLPDEPPDPLPLSAHAANAYRAEVPAIAVAVTFQAQGRPIAGEAYAIDGLPELDGTSDGAGQVKLELPLTATRVRLRFPARGLAFWLRVGELDPIDEASGARARLRALGFYHRLGEFEHDDASDEAAEAEEAAVRAFQKANGLPDSGALDAATLAALKSAHGS